MSPHTTFRRSVIAAVTSLMILSLARPGIAQEAELQRIEELRECIDKTDPQRGQNPSWRAEKCPLDEEAAKAELAQLIEEVKEKAEQALTTKKEKEDEAKRAGSAPEEDGSSQSGSPGRLPSVKGAASVSGDMSTPRLPSLTPLPAKRLNDGLVVPDPTVLCATGTPSFTGSVPPLPTLVPAPPQGEGLIAWGSGQIAGACEALLGTLGSLPQTPLPAVGRQTQAAPLAPLFFDVEKTAEGPGGFAQVAPDQQFVWHITVENISSATADGVMRDMIPLPVDVVSINHGGFDACAIASSVLECIMDDMGAGDTAFIDLTMRVDEGFCDEEGTPPLNVVPNTAETHIPNPAGGEPPTILDDSSTSAITIVCQQVLDVEKQILDDDLPVQSGETFSYLITLTNEQEEGDVAASITDDLPAQLEVVSFQVFGLICSITDHQLQCFTESLEAGETVSVIVQMRVPEDVCGERREGIQNIVQAFLEVVQSGPIPADADRVLLNVPCSDPGIEKTASDDEVFAGELVTFFLNAFNAGPGTATNVVVEDQLPSGFEFVSVDPGAPTCTEDGSGLVTCELGDLPVKTNVLIEIVARAGSTEQSPCGTRVTNTATIAADNEQRPLLLRLEDLTTSQTRRTTTGGGEPASNESSAIVTVLCAPNLTITKTAEAVGRDITYTITAANTGTETANGVVVEDNLDNALNQVEASASQGACVVGPGNSVTCEIGDIPVDTSETVTITARAGVAACPSVVNEAEGTAVNEPEGAQGDNSDRVRITVDCVLPSTTTRDGAVLGSLAATGLGLLPLLLLAGLLLGAGEVTRRAGQERKRRKHT